MYYTYLAIHKASGKRYYGSRYCKSARPEDLGSSYFTSSKIVKKIIKSEGTESFTFSIRKTFNSVEACRNWEAKVLRRLNAAANPNWYNVSNGNGSFLCTGHTPETIEKFKARTGWTHSEETKKKMSETATGRKNAPISDVTRQRMSETRKRIGISAEMREKMNEGIKRRTYYPSPSIETRTKISYATKGENNPYFGRKHSDEVRTKMSEKRKQTPKQECSNCGKLASPSMIARWHNKNCRLSNIF